MEAMEKPRRASKCISKMKNQASKYMVKDTMMLCEEKAVEIDDSPICSPPNVEPKGE